MNVFIVAPYRVDPESRAKQQILAKVAKDYDVLLHFAHKEPVGSNIEESLATLRNSDLVIADLSYERPSCYYEVGYTQALGKPISIIAKFGTTLHQVRQQDNVQFYNNLDEFSNLIQDIMRERTEHLCQ